MIRLSLCPQPFASSGLEAALDAAVELGVAAIELPVNSGTAPLADLDELLAGGCDRLQKAVERRKLAISAISLHQDGQLLLGPHHRDTDAICPGSPEQKIAFARERLLKGVELAARLEVPALIGFVGCEDQTRLF